MTSTTVSRKATRRRATRRQRRLDHVQTLMASARTPEERLAAAYDAYRAVAAVARKRHVDDIVAHIEEMAENLLAAAERLDRHDRETGPGQRL